MTRPVFLLACVTALALSAAPRAVATSVSMWLAVDVTQVDAVITTLAVGDRFAIALTVNDAVLDQNSSIGGGQFPNLLSDFTMTAFPTNAGTWVPSGTFDLPASNFVDNAFGNGFTFQVRGTGFPDGGPGLPFFDVDLNFSWLGDITDSGLGDSFAQQLGGAFDPTRAILGPSAIRFAPPTIPEATLATASNFFLWTNAGSGDWTTNSNWRPHGQPNSSADVNISNGGTAQITTAGAQAQKVFLGQLIFGGSGHLEVTSSPASLSAQDIVVGDDGTGTLSITAGGTVSTTNGGDIGIQAGSSGTVTVTGAGSAWTSTGTLELAESGDGSLTVSNGALVTSLIGELADDDVANAVVTVTGAGSRWNMTGQLVVADDGTATMSILDGGAVSNTNATIGADTVAVGTVTVAGAGSTWTNDGSITVGVEAEGSLTIEDGGSVSNHDGHIGAIAGSTGMVTVTGAGSTWNNSTSLTVGESGTGALTIQDGGHVSNLHAGFIGANTGSSGMAIVSGTGSTWTNTTNLRVGHFGTGTLRIEAGGHVSNLHSVVGDFSGSNGTAIVSGAGSTWTNSANFIVAHSTTGTLTIEAGGAVSNVNGYIGLEIGSIGLVTVTGAGSQWQNTGSLFVGGEPAEPGGQGTLRIQTGGTVVVAQNTDLFADGHIHLEGGTLDAQSISFQGGGEFDWTSGTLHVGSFNGNLTNQAGTLAPGHSAGSTTIAGFYAQQAGAKLEIEIGGTTPGSTYDVVNITSIAGLSGQLQLALPGGFLPSASDTFTVLSAASGIFGAFSNVANSQRLTTSDGIGSFLVHYGLGSPFNQNQVVLSAFEAVLLPGDYNDDGVVDAADYVLWRKTFGMSGFALAADGNGNNQIDSGDYDVWTAHFGESLGSGSGAAVALSHDSDAAVPEPGSVTFVCLAIICGVRRGHRMQLGRRS